MPVGPHYSENLTICYNDCDLHNELHFSMLQRLCSDISEKHSALQGISRQELFRRNCVFLLSRMSIQILQMPQGGQSVTLHTYEEQPQGVQYLRYFTIEDENKHRLLQAETRWVLVDPQTHRILRPKAAQLPFVYGEIPAFPGLPAADKLLAGDEETPVYQTKVGYAQIDMNGHMNNARYADLVENALSHRLLTQRIHTFRINFVKEARMGEQLTLLQSEKEGLSLLRAQNQDHTCFIAEVSLVNRSC